MGVKPPFIDRAEPVLAASSIPRYECSRQVGSSYLELSTEKQAKSMQMQIQWLYEEMPGIVAGETMPLPVPISAQSTALL
jgi:hypothetical protein